MAERQDDVRRHYGIPVLVEKLLDELKNQGQDPERFKPEALYPYDQLHGRELAATKDHVARLALKPGMKVLDVGSGIGGPARYIAATTGASVDGVDLTHEFVEAAAELTKRCGLAGKAHFHQGDALALPFGGDHFDAAFCLYVAMNIEGKAALAAEIARVLKPGGKVVWSQVVLGGKGAPTFPLPWASSPEYSFLLPPDDLRAAIESAGLKVTKWSDESGIIAVWMRERQAEAKAGKQPPSALGLAMGADFAERRRKYAENMMEGRIGSILAVAEKPR
jgi:SAM-dependent methyltransferase